MKVYIGIDAHSTNYTLGSYNSEADDCTNAVTLKPEYEGIVKYAEKINAIFSIFLPRIRISITSSHAFQFILWHFIVSDHTDAVCCLVLSFIITP